MIVEYRLRLRDLFALRHFAQPETFLARLRMHGLPAAASVALIIALCSVMESAAGQKPIPLVDSTKRLEFQGFSLLPPGGKEWFIAEPQSLPAPSAETVTFFKIVGRMHSIYCKAMLVASPSTQTLEEFKALVQREAKQNPRFRNLKADASAGKCLGYDCVRFDVLSEDHSPDDFPGSVLMITRKGFVVPHPSAPGFYVWVEYSERFAPRTQRYALDREVEPFLRSLQFAPIRRTYDFPDDCKLPRGETEAFSYGCEQGSYRMRLKRAGPVHAAGSLGLSARAVSLEVIAAVRSGRGTEPGEAMLGIGCLAGPERGYVALLKTDGAAGIVRSEGTFIPLAGSKGPGEVSLSGSGARLRISCVSESAKKATLVSIFVNDKKVASVEDERDYGPFNTVFLYADTFPGDVVFQRLVVTEPPE